MGAALRLREDYGADDLRGFACKARDGAQARRLMALAAVAAAVNGKLHRVVARSLDAGVAVGSLKIVRCSTASQLLWPHGEWRAPNPPTH